MNETLKSTPLLQSHLELKARMVPFAGWNMPVQYSGLLDEHKTIRTNVGIFDVSHMGEIEVTGRGAAEFVDKITINLASKMPVGSAQYNAMCYENGTLVDDIVVYRRGIDSFFICVNSSNIEKDFDWIKEHKPASGVNVENFSDNYAQIAIQGPKSRELLAKIVDIKIENLGYYHFAEGKVFGAPAIIARTGYTGELGYEIYFPAQKAAQIWQGLLDNGQEFSIKPCGLGARDTLRLEMGFLLYGNDMDNTTTALECGLDWILKFEKENFIGREALFKQKEAGIKRKLVGFEMNGRAIGRHGYRVFDSQNSTDAVGVVTSGSPSPTLNKNIGLAYVPIESSRLNSPLYIEIRGERWEANVVKKPFYTLGSAKK